MFTLILCQILICVLKTCTSVFQKGIKSFIQYNSKPEQWKKSYHNKKGGLKAEEYVPGTCRKELNLWRISSTVIWSSEKILK